MRSIVDHFRSPPNRLVRTLGVVGLFAALSVAHTWPLGRAPSTDMHLGPDPTTGMWAMTEISRQMARDPAHLMDGNVFYPFPGTIAILDHQFASALLAVPLVVAGVNGVLTYNVVILAIFLLNGVFTFLLVRRLTDSEPAGLVAGCAFAFSSYHAYHLPQTHVLATQWLPLALLALHGYLERPTWRRWTAFTVTALLVALTSWQIGVLGAVALGMVALWTLVADTHDMRRKAAGLLLAATVCGAALLPLAGAYARLGAQWPPPTGGGRETVGTLAGNSADLLGLVARPFNARAPYAPLLSFSEHSQPGVFPGLVVLVLVLPALATLGQLRRPPTTTKAKLLRWSLRGTAALVVLIVVAAAAGPRGDPLVGLLRPLAPFACFGLTAALAALLLARRTGAANPELSPTVTYAALAAAGILLAMGPRVLFGDVDLGSGLWRFDLLPLRLIIRAPDRLSLLLMLGASVLAGIGMARLLRRCSPKTAPLLTVAVLVALNADLAFREPAFLTVPAPREVDHWLADLPDEGAVVEFPLVGNYWASYASQGYDRRTVNGQGYLFPWEYRQMEEVPDFSAAQMTLLWEHFHPRFVVIRGDLYEPAERARVDATIEALGGALQPLVRFGSDAVYELADRGRDTELFRRWPLAAIRDSRFLDLDGSVTPGRDGTAGKLVVTLNGRIVLEARGADAETRTSHSIPFAPEDLERGMNVFHIWADYQITDSAETHPIGTTGVNLAADVLIRSDRDRARVQINGWVTRPDKGYFLAVIDPVSGEISATGLFNVSWYAEDSEALVAFVDRIPAGYPVVVATAFDASRELTAGAVEALRELGLEVDLRDKFQVLHAAIGVKGAAPGSALEVSGNPPTLTLELGTPDRREVQLETLRLRR